MDPSSPNYHVPSWTRADVATYLKSSVRTVDRLVEARRLRSFKVGRSVRFRPVDVIALHTTQPVDQPVNSEPVDEIDQYLEKLVSAAPKLSPAQRDRIAALLGGAA
jgi:excisionase family DNA binding protein